MTTTTTKLIVAIASIAIVAGAGYGLYSLGMNRGMKMAAPAAVSGKTDNGAIKAGDVDPANGKRVLYWQDPMVPGQRFDKPGKSPFMDMQLAPVYAEGAGDEASVSISPRIQQSLGIRTAEVARTTLAPTVEAVGSVAYNERDVAVVQARSNGFLEKLYVRAPLDPVRKGQPLAEMYVPDWVAAQEEYLSAKRIASQTQVPGLGNLIDGARQRMRLVGMTEEQIRVVEANGKVQPRLVIVSPIGGVVGELMAREGMTVMAGAPLYRINGLGTVWVNAEVPESKAAQVRPGNAVEARAAGLPNARFKGLVSAILPEVNPATRTLKARIEIANPQEKLVPGMFVTVSFAPSGRREVLVVPSEAVIQTGKRTVVMVAEGDGKFLPVEVEPGIETNGRTEIRKGLDAGQKVVISGQFLIDSEASLRSTAIRMGEPGDTQVAAATHHGRGVVERLDKDEVTISHDAIPSLKWGAMTMGFKLPGDFGKKVAVGDKIDFDFRQGKDGGFEITSVAPAAAEAVKPPHVNGAAKGAGK